MNIIFTKKTPTHHLFRIERADGTSEEKLIETKSFMPHDLIHYAYESTAALQDSFYGLLAQGDSLDTLVMTNEIDGETQEIVVTEMLTGPLSAFLTKDMSVEGILEGVHAMFAAHHRPMPPHITHHLLHEVKETYSTVDNRWRMLPHHVPLILEWKE